MKNLKLNLKGLYGYRQSHLSRSPQPRDNREMSERRPSEERTLLAPLPQRFARYAAMLIMLLTLGVGQMWGNYAYLDLTGFTSWYDGSAKFRVDKNGSGNVDSYTEISGSGVWRFNIGDYTGAVTYKRMKSDYSEQWNYFNGSISSSQNVAHITGWNGSGSMQTSFVINYIHGTNHVYFDNSTSQFTGNIYLVIGHDYSPSGSSNTYSKAYKMSKVSNTNNLWYVSVTDTWEDATYYAVIGNSAASISETGWGSGSLSSKGTGGYTAAYKTVYNMEGGSYLITTASSGNNQAMTITYKDGYSALNTQHTLNQTLSTNGGSTYSSSTNSISTTLSISSNKMNNNGSTTSSSGSISSGNSSTTCDAARTATVSFSVTEKTGYTFIGWYEGSTQKSTSKSWSFTDAASEKTITARFNAKQYTVTLDHKGGTSGPSNPTVTYNVKPSDLASLPTKAGYGFDGYWTQDGSSTGDYGIQVIDGTGKWISGVAYNTDASGNWIHDGDQTYYAKWLAVGYYLVGGPGLDNWVTKSDKRFSGSPLGLELALNKSSFESNKPTLTALFKIRQVKEGASSTDKWFGKGAKDGDVSFGKYNPTEEDLGTSGANMQLEVYYNGTYTFTISNIDDVNTQLDLTVAVPVIDQLQIYSGCDGTSDAYYNWNGAPVDNVVSKTVTLDNCSEPNGFYFKAVYDSEYYGKNSTTLTRASSSATELSTSGGNILIKTDIKGNYTFNFNVVDHSISVTYPTKRQVNYSAVTLRNGTGADAPTAENDDDDDEAVANGGYVADGYHVTFRAKTAKTGYTFRGWFSKNDPSNWSDGLLEDDAVYTTTISANTTVYAVYSENDYTVTVNATTGGSITTPSAPATTVTAHPATGTAIVAALADASWYFTGWTVTSGTAAFADASALSTTVTASEAATIQANFARRYELRGSLISNTEGGMPGWVSNDAVFTGTVTSLGTDNGVDLTCTRVLNPNAEYKFVVHDRKTNKNMGYNPRFTDIADQSLLLDDQDQEVKFYTAGRGSYTFKITRLSNDANQYPTVKLVRQTSHLVSIGQGYADIDGTITTNNTTGGTISAKATESGTKVDITNGKYIADGGKLEWTVAPADGYRLEHYYGSSSLTGAYFDFTQIDPVNGAANVYAKFVENSTAVTIAHNEHGHVTVGGETATSTTVGITTTRALVAVPDAGYYFAGWTVPDASDFELQDKDEEDEEDPEVTLHGLGTGTAGTLTANFVEEDKIYFRNIDQSTGNKLWDKEHIYVYFDVTWADEGGYGGVQNPSNYKEMSPFGSTKIYWAYVPHSFTKSGHKNVAFSDVDMHGYDEFHDNKGVYRTDYSRITNMYVPNHTSSGSNNGTTYYSNGYWKVFDPQIGVGQGYYLQLHTGTKTYEQKGEFTAVANGSSKISYTMRVDNTSTQSQYRIVSAGGLNYVTDATITSAAYENVNIIENPSCDNCYLTVNLTSEGDYTFVIDQSGDNMTLTVNYPVSVGDYRLKHTYNDGSDKTTYSDVIKANDASTPHTLSMYLSTAGTETLVLQKCTTITAGVPQWNAGDATNLGGILTTVGTKNGVYKFDVSVSADKVSSAPTATLYTGPYYIKTDGATGGWVNYTQNSMTENTLNFDAEDPEESFNYYYCKYYNAAGNNLKCVIANDYCNALTDTLIGDDVLGVQDAKPRQTTPSAVSVRFSYNSYTNEIKRSYLGASMASDFLRIEGDQTASKPHIYDKNESTFDDSHADAYITFEDKQNWRYEIIIKADANARAKLTAAFNGHTQYFWGAEGESGHEWDNVNTEQLFGGTSGTYGLTLIYDFKTNKLITAWTPTGDAINSDLTLNSDVLLLREHQGAPTSITFGDKGGGEYASLTQVKTVYSILRFNRWKLSNRAHPEDVDTEHCKTTDLINTHHPALTVNQDDEAGKWLPQAERELYFISFPYDVKMSDIIHFGGYYDTWGIMYYDGKGRAKNGYWIDSESNWKYFTPEEFATKELKAYEGYLIGIDLAAMAYNNTSFWTNNSSEVDIYFPSKTAVSTITQKAVTVDIDTVGYQCNINRSFGGDDGDRRIKDSHWHCIGVPSYANLSHAINNGAPSDASWSNKELLYLYRWNTSTNEHSIEKASSFSFQAMYAYLVQYAGKTLSWAAASATGPASIAAKRVKTEELRDRQFDLQLLQGDKEEDHTYIRLSDDEEVTAGFEFNHDVSKMMLSGANIYTLIGTEQAAANSLPLNLEQTTVVPVGVKIATNGNYTFSIPEGTEGIGVFLIDNITGTRTNLGLMDYTTTLTAGTHHGRFTLEISPVNQVPTGIETVGGNDSNARKVMIDGILYIVKDGKIFDARGSRVE